MADRFITPCALPTDHEREVLTILIEEAAEVQQRATKLLRFGRDEVQPGQAKTNAQRLSQEIGDLMAMVQMAARLGLVIQNDILQARADKDAKLPLFMQTKE